MFGALADKVFGSLGYVLMRREHLQERQGTLGWERLGEVPVRPRTVIDVGVGYGTPELYAAFPDARLVLVEPLDEYEAAIGGILARRPGTHHRVALGPADGELVFNVEPKDRQKSSFLARSAETATADAVERRTVRVRSLDSLLRDEPLEGPVVLKVDVEGFEIQALSGAAESLARIDLVIIEASITRRFEAPPNFAAIVATLDRHGFRLYDILNIARTAGPGARHADLVFVRA